MSIQKDKTLFEANSLIDLYIILSFAISVLFWIGEFYLIQNFIGKSLFPSLLVLGNYWFFKNIRGRVEGLKDSISIPLYFLFQSACLIGTAFQFERYEMLFLAFMPCLCGSFHFLHKYNNNQGLLIHRAVGLTALFYAVYAIFYSFVPHSSFNTEMMFTLLSFCLWSQGMIFLGGEFLNLKQKSYFSRIFRLSKSGKNQAHIAVKDKYFFHDLINHTHSLNLFLSIKKDQGLDASECEIVCNEVKVLQSLIKDHFALGHKNLDDTYEYVSFDVAKQGLFNMVENYLPEEKVKCHFLFKGLLDDMNFFKYRSFCKVHYPSFYRIMNNLIKNISEQGSIDAEFIFDYQDMGLKIQVKNRILTLKDNRRELAGNLKKIILSGDNKQLAGIGLESVQTLCEDLNGSFEFHIEGDFWISEIFLPRLHSINETFAA